jgi:hypothetical protein
MLNNRLEMLQDLIPKNLSQMQMDVYLWFDQDSFEIDNNRVSY